jgi:hypothetical protein
MRKLSNRTGPVDYGPEPGQARNIAGLIEGSIKELVRRANAVPLTNVLKLYGARVGEYSHNITCPFKSHKNGKERTPSFSCYLETNSFYCHTCHIGGGPVNFVLNYDGIDKEDAARKILQVFNDDVDDDLLFAGSDINEQTEAMLEFSKAVLDFRQSHETEHAYNFIEYVCWVYDRMNLLHKHDSGALKSLNAKLIDWINEYTEDLRLKMEGKYLELVNNG